MSVRARLDLATALVDPLSSHILTVQDIDHQEVQVLPSQRSPCFIQPLLAADLGGLGEHLHVIAMRRLHGARAGKERPRWG